MLYYLIIAQGKYHHPTFNHARKLQTVYA